MASPISKSPRRGRSPSPRSPRFKFTIFPPDVYAPITLNYMPSTDKSYKFCSFLKDKFETHFGMRCSLPTAAGTAYIGDFDEFERLFLIDSEYIVVVVTQKSVTALRKFYPRLLVFVTVRPEWVNRFILVFVGDVALDPCIDLSVLIHQPIIFKQSDWEADLNTWKALHKLLKVEWTPHKEDKPSPTRRGEVLSVIQRTVVETEVQEVRTRRRSSSRNSDSGSATPGTLSPLPGASRKRLTAPSDGTDLHIVSPSAEKPNIVEEMASGRRKFGGQPEVEASKPVVLESPPSSSNEQKQMPKVVIQRPTDNGTMSKEPPPEALKAPPAPKVIIKRETPESNAEAQRPSGEKARPTNLFGAGKDSEKAKDKPSDKRDSWKFASEVRTKKPRDKPAEEKGKAVEEGPKAVEEPVTASRGQGFRSTPPPKTVPSPGDKPKESEETITPERTTGQRAAAAVSSVDKEKSEEITPERKRGQRAAPVVDKEKSEREIAPEKTTVQRTSPEKDEGKSKRPISLERKIEKGGQETNSRRADNKVENEVFGNNNKEKEAGPGTKGDKESSQESIQTSGYSSLDSSISTRSMGHIPTTPVSMKVSPFEGESSTDVSYVTAPETLSLPAPQQAALSPDENGEKPAETPEISDLASLPSEAADKQEVEAFQIPKGSDETKKEKASLAKSVEAMAGPHQPGQVVEKKYEEDGGRIVNVKVSSEAAKHPFTGVPVISKAIEIDVEGDDDETFFFSTEFDEMLVAPPPPSLSVPENNESVVRLRRNLRLLESAFGGAEQEAAVAPRKRGFSGGDAERPQSSSCITVSNDLDEAPGRYRTTMTVSKSSVSSLREKSVSMTSLHPEFNIFTVPRAARSVENISTEARHAFRPPEAFIVTTQMPDMSCARPRSLTAVPATPDSPPRFTFEVGSPTASQKDLLHVTSTKELFTHAVGVVEVSGEPEIEVATIQEPRVLTGLEVSLPGATDAAVTSRVEFLASGVETASPQQSATLEMEVGGPEEALPSKPAQKRTFRIPESGKIPCDEEITARTTASLNAAPQPAADKGATGGAVGGSANAKPGANPSAAKPGATPSAAVPGGTDPEEGLGRKGMKRGAEKPEPRRLQGTSKSPEDEEITVRTTASLNAAPQPVADKGAEKPESGKVILTARRSGKDSATPGKFILTARKAEQGSANPGKVILSARKADQDSDNPRKVVLTPRKADSAVPEKVILTPKRANPDSKASGSPATVEEKSARIPGTSAEDMVVPDDAERQRTSPGESPHPERNAGNHESPLIASRNASQTSEDAPGRTEGGVSTNPSETRAKEGRSENKSQEGEAVVPKKANGSSIPMLKIQPATPIDSSAKLLDTKSAPGDSPSNHASKDDVRTKESPSTESLSVDDCARSHGSPAANPSRLPTATVAPSPKLPILPSVGPRSPLSVGKVASVPGVSRSSDGSMHQADSRGRCLLDDLSYASLTSEEDGLRILRRDESLEVPVFDDDKEKRVWMLTSLALRLPRSLMSVSAGMLASTWVMASNAGIAVGRMVWPGTNFNDKPNRPFRILILATATALSPLYRQLSMSFFEMLSTFLWPPLEGMIEAGLVSFPVAQISTDSTVAVTETLPQLRTLSIVSPSQFGRAYPTELILPSRFVFWVTSPPR